MSNHDADLTFVHRSNSREAGHSIGITVDGISYSYCYNPKTCDNELGQLGRMGNANAHLPITLQHDGNVSLAAYSYTGGLASSGHSGELFLEFYVCCNTAFMQINNTDSLFEHILSNSRLTWTPLGNWMR